MIIQIINCFEQFLFIISVSSNTFVFFRHWKKSNQIINFAFFNKKWIFREFVSKFHRKSLTKFSFSMFLHCVVIKCIKNPFYILLEVFEQIFLLLKYIDVFHWNFILKTSNHRWLKFFQSNWFINFFSATALHCYTCSSDKIESCATLRDKPEELPTELCPANFASCFTKIESKSIRFLLLLLSIVTS